MEDHCYPFIGLRSKRKSRQHIVENIDRSDSIRGVYVNQGVALRTELNQGTMQRRGASPPPVSETNLL
ncbi:Hypothetical predicted protein, partial [Olea europaea subsp. europaea]